MDELCNKMNNINVDSKLIRDIDIIIKEIIEYKTYDVDIYDICVSCGHDLTWDMEYTISNPDVYWIINFGKDYFISELNSKMVIDTGEKYIKAVNLYNKMFELFGFHF